MIDYSYQNN